MQGYIHSTGHGLGLEIHEGPRIGPHGDVLESGHVVTMEPGLYYRGLGGVRIEDTVVVAKTATKTYAAYPRCSKCERGPFCQRVLSLTRKGN